MTIRISRLFLVLALGAAAPDLAGQQTWVVDVAGGGDFVDLPDAYDNAAPGDTLLVRPGTYSGFERGTGLAKGMRILGDDPGTVTVHGGIELIGIPADQPLVISGLTIEGYTALTIWRAGLVVASDLVLIGGTLDGMEGGVGISLADCDGVVDHVIATGGAGGARGANPYGYQGGNGGHFAVGRFQVTASQFESGDSSRGPSGVTLATHEGCFVFTAQLVIDETSCTSGVPTHSTSAGLGALTQTGVCSVYLANYSGQPITTIDARGLATIDGPGGRPSLTGPSSVTTGQPASWTVRAAPGELALLMGGIDVAAYSSPMFDGTSFLLGSPSAVGLGLVRTNSSGLASLTLTIPNLPELVDQFAFVQAYGGSPGERLRCSGVSAQRIR